MVLRNGRRRWHLSEATAAKRHDNSVVFGLDGDISSPFEFNSLSDD
jgi:ribosomal protein L16 Arg81 hydroxylase